MVKLTKIYTRTGDDGETGLGDGTRVRKHDLRVVAYGEVDEANAVIGMVLVELDREKSDGLEHIAGELSLIQNDLFDVGADLCVPVKPDEQEGACLRVQPSQTARLERAIDALNAQLPTLESFVLPGGSAAAATLHLARTTARRAERTVAELIDREATRVNPEAVMYLNRLSDLLFVMARAVNAHGAGDVLWVPGANRDESEGAAAPDTPGDQPGQG
ncbi:MAG: cob(I)yrinic acid a,c-diamide adenosyltransferase [Phycisphaerales bacterium]